MKLMDIKATPTKEDELAQSFWDPDTSTIYLLKGQNELLQARCFRHELEHAFVEWKDWWEDQFGIEDKLLHRDEE